MSPFYKALRSAYHPGTHLRVKSTNANPKKTSAPRHGASQKLRTLSVRLQPARRRLTRKLKPKAPDRSLNIPLIVILTTYINYTDKVLPRDLVYGVGIAWEIETTNSISPWEYQKNELGTSQEQPLSQE